MSVITENGQKTLRFAADRNTLDGARLPGTIGYVYVFRRSDFTKRSDEGKQAEWTSLKPVTPVMAVAVKPRDLPPNIEVIENE